MAASGTRQDETGRNAASLRQRRAARRAELLEMGIRLLGAAERPGVTVRAVCRGSGLTERYFYESFDDRDEFVRAVYAEVGDRAHQALSEVARRGGAPAEMAAAAIEAFVALLVDNPAMGRVLLLAPLTEPALSGQGLELVPAFVTLVHEQLSGVDDPGEKRMTALGVVGALTNLFIAYLGGTLDVPREQLVRHCVALLLDANRAAR